MKDNESLIESLIERTTEYGKTSFELMKLKALDKTSEVVSSFVPNSIFAVFILSFILFLSAGIALWLGEILGKTYYGLFVVAAFYGFAGIFFHFVLRKNLKKRICDNFIKQVLK